MTPAATRRHGGTNQIKLKESRMRVRTPASSAVAIVALISAVALWGARPGVAPSQSEQPSTAASTEGTSPTTLPLPTEG